MKTVWSSKIGKLTITLTNENEVATPKGEKQRYGSIFHEGRLTFRTPKWFERARWVRVSWSSFKKFKSAHYDVTFGDGDSGRDLQFCFTIPFVTTVWLTIENCFKKQLFEHDFDRGDDREIGIAFHGGAMWWKIWVGTMASWSRDYPWCKKWRQGNINFLDTLLGRNQVEWEVMEKALVAIPMPEGVYHGEATVKKRIDKRPRWFAKVSYDTWIDVPKGIPFQGKGENSWDCGDDGIFGTGVTGRSIPDAIGHYVAAVLSNRVKYGMPSDAAITRALAS